MEPDPPAEESRPQPPAPESHRGGGSQLRDMLGLLGAPAPAASAPAAPAAPAPPSATPASAASGVLELLSLAARVEDLDVPERQRPIVRAALVDLWRQMESPPVRWETLRAAVALAMEHPTLARRVLPLIVPHLDRAA